MKKLVKSSVKSVVGSVVEIIREGDGVAKKKISARYKRNNKCAIEEALETYGDFMLVNNKFGQKVVYYKLVA